MLAWGNPGRLDDGLGPAFADLAAQWGFDSLTTDSGYQLHVEDAHEAARYRRGLFVDADRTCPEPFRMEKIEAGKSGIAFSSHSVSPESVLALARDLFGAEPEAWLVGIRGYEFDEFGERLSERARANLETAAEFVRQAFRSNDYKEFRAQAAEVSHG